MQRKFIIAAKEMAMLNYCLSISLAFGLIAAAPTQAQQLITDDQIEAYRNGAPPSEIVLSTGETLQSLLKGAAPEYEVEWLIVSGGGISEDPAAVNDSSSPKGATGNQYELVSSIGLSVVGELSDDGCGDDHRVRFGILEENAGVFGDGFECGNLSRWSSSVPSVP